MLYLHEFILLVDIQCNSRRHLYFADISSSILKAEIQYDVSFIHRVINGHNVVDNAQRALCARVDDVKSRVRFEKILPRRT